MPAWRISRKSGHRTPASGDVSPLMAECRNRAANTPARRAVSYHGLTPPARLTTVNHQCSFRSRQSFSPNRHGRRLAKHPDAQLALKFPTDRTRSRFEHAKLTYQKHRSALRLEYPIVFDNQLVIKRADILRPAQLLTKRRI